MAGKRKGKLTFEEGMDALEALVAHMNDGKMTLEQSMKTYEEGMALVSSLEEMLAQHKKRIEQIDLHTGEIKDAFEENEYGIS